MYNGVRRKSVGRIAAGMLVAALIAYCAESLVAEETAGKPDVESVIAEAAAELAKGVPLDAALRLDRALFAAGDGASPELLFFAAIAAAETKRSDNAAKYIQKALDATGADEAAQYALAEKFLRRGIVSVPALLYSQIIKTLPADSQFDVFSNINLASYHHLRGRNNLSAGHMASLMRPIDYGDFIAIDSTEINYMTAVFDGLRAADAGDAKRGIEILRRAASLNPDAVLSDALLCKTLEESGRTKEAVSVRKMVTSRLRAKISSEPENAEYYHALAHFLAECGKETQAGLKAVDRALVIAPLMPRYLATKAVLLDASGKNDEALKFIRRAIAANTGSRWMRPGLSVDFALKRLDILEKTGRHVPQAFRELDRDKPEKP